MPIGDSITPPVPAVGTAGTTYASQIVAFLTEVKARLEAKVALTSLLAGLFDLSNNGIANAAYVELYEQASAPTTPVGSIQRYGGELYYVSSSGAVRITNGGALDVVSANGITGDYAAPAEFKYDVGALEYFAYSDEAAGNWARVGAQGFDIYGTLAGTTRVRLSWAGGLSPSYTLTLPAAVPASSAILRMDASGNLTANVRTGRKKVIGPAEYQAEDVTSTNAPTFRYTAGFNLGATTWRIVVPITLNPGDTLTDVKTYLNKTIAGTVFAAIYKVDYLDGTRTAIESNTTSVTTGDTFIQVTSAPITELIDDGHYYEIEIYTDAVTTGNYLRATVLTYDEATS
jgi:hypothetical protein